MTQEFWLRGPLPEIPSLLQPVAHALLQSRDEVTTMMTDFPPDLLWNSPGGMATPGFHLMHFTGVIDRLFTYAKGEQLSPEQIDSMKKEKSVHHDLTADELLSRFSRQVDRALDQLRSTDETTLTNERLVGRKALPSTVMGLLFHAAEHTMRHTGQLLVTVNVLKNSYAL
ncbi:MAG TPA: DinB family protein [Sphingobacteriaceae bacterium]